MAGTIRTLCRLNTHWINNVIVKNTYFNVFGRTIYSPRSIGMTGYEKARTSFRLQFANVDSTFREKMKNVCEDKDSMIFTEDLKAIVHLVDKKPEDTELLLNMVLKFHNQSKEIKFGTFVFGPVVMRACYYLNEPEVALQMYKHPDLKNFFNQLSTTQVLFSLLYKNQRYSDILDVFEIVKDRDEDKGLLKGSIIVLYAALYHQNTQEALAYGLEQWKHVAQKMNIIPRRAITFLSYLAIKQDAAHIALELITTIREPRYIDARCLKILAYAQLKKFTEIVPIFKWSLESDRPNTRKEYYFCDVINSLEVALQLEESPDPELIDVLKRIKMNDFIMDKTLESHICNEIDIQRSPMPNQTFSSEMNNQRQRTRTLIRDLI